MGNPTYSILLSMFIVVIICETLCIVMARPCHPVDEEALLDVKRRITRNQERAFKTWINTNDCCTGWMGVYCDPDNGRVDMITWFPPGAYNYNRLDLDSHGRFNFDNDGPISGTISPYLGNLTYLKVIDFSLFGNLTGSIPIELGRLTRLEDLELTDNNLSGIIPDQIFQSMKELTVLCLSRNKLSGPIPSSIWRSTSLTELLLDDNHLSDELSSSIGNLMELRYFNLSGNDISGSIPPSILNLKHLAVFDVSKNRLTGKIPHHKVHLPASGFIGNRGLCDAPLPPCTSGLT